MALVLEHYRATQVGANSTVTVLRRGLYASASEVIRAGLRLLQEQDEIKQIKLEALRREIKKGIESGRRNKLINADDVFAEVRIRSAKRRKK